MELGKDDDEIPPPTTLPARTQGWLNPQKLRERFAEEEEPLPSWWHDEVPGSKIVFPHLSGEGC